MRENRSDGKEVNGRSRRRRREGEDRGGGRDGMAGRWRRGGGGGVGHRQLPQRGTLRRLRTRGKRRTSRNFLDSW